MSTRKTETVEGITYYLPEVFLLQDSGIGVAEIAARTCYDSFELSENSCIKEAPKQLDRAAINAIEQSDLLMQLAWVHHHHSIIEHATLSYLIKGTSRGVLQEHARHRIQAISVRSTRYTMSSILNAYVASLLADDPKNFFIQKVDALDMLAVADKEYRAIEIGTMFDKLSFQKEQLNNEVFIQKSVAKSSLPLLEEIQEPEALFEALESGKKKRNVGDAFKHIVTDNWKVDLVVTFNIRSLKNYFDLRDSGAAWFQIRWLAKAMKEATPKKYLQLIDRQYK